MPLSSSFFTRSMVAGWSGHSLAEFFHGYPAVGLEDVDDLPVNVIHDSPQKKLSIYNFSLVYYLTQVIF
jgi:hypothetical protein